MAFPFRPLAWAFVTLVCVGALLSSVFRPDAAGPILGTILFALYVGLLTEAILDVTARDDLSMRQRALWLALCVLVLPLVPVMAGVYFLAGRRQTALMVGGPVERAPEPWEGRVPHKPYSVVRWGRKAARGARASAPQQVLHEVDRRELAAAEPGQPRLGAQ